MFSKSWPTTSTAQCQASSRQLKSNTGNIIYTDKCKSEGSKKISEKHSEESLERAIKSERSSESCNHTFGSRELKTSNKRRCTAEDNIEIPRKISRRTHRPAEEHIQTFTDISFSEDAETSSSINGITTEAEGRRNRAPSLFECPDHKATSSDKPGSSLSENTRTTDSTDAFEAKYKEQERIGAGGFGLVFAGHRKVDNLPVAIKHIPQFDIKRTSMLLGGKVSMVPLEVALMLEVRPEAAGSSAAVTLLDWYDRAYELILVLERPVPCLDLIDYMNSTGSALQENLAKTITKQLVDAFIELHSRGVFHRDIKLDNILIETGSDIPRVRLIDFGCGTYLSEGIYITEQGTYGYTSPEWFLHGWYRAEPTTVWQLGVVLFGMLHRFLPFRNSIEIVQENPDISGDLSFNCQDFLQSCLEKSPEARPTLETLKHHNWLI